MRADRRVDLLVDYDFGSVELNVESHLCLQSDPFNPLDSIVPFRTTPAKVIWIDDPDWVIPTDRGSVKTPVSPVHVLVTIAFVPV